MAFCNQFCKLPHGCFRSNDCCARWAQKKTERLSALRFPTGGLRCDYAQTIAPVEFEQTLDDCEWLAVALQVGGVVAATVAATVTFCEGVKPCEEPSPEKYAPL
jgi:hypothetical protein